MRGSKRWNTGGWQFRPLTLLGFAWEKPIKPRNLQWIQLSEQVFDAKISSNQKSFALWFVRNAESCPNPASKVFLESMNESYLLTPGGHFASLNGHHARPSLVEILLFGWKWQAYRELSSELLFRCTRTHGPYEPEIGFLTSFRWRVL